MSEIVSSETTQFQGQLFLLFLVCKMKKQGGLDRTNNVFWVSRYITNNKEKNYLLKFIIRGQKKRLFHVLSLRFQAWERLLRFDLK